MQTWTCMSVHFRSVPTTFSFTRPSAALMERIAVSVERNEPVLLVGETGTGKTSSVQFLARQCGEHSSYFFFLPTATFFLFFCFQLQRQRGTN